MLQGRGDGDGEETPGTGPVGAAQGAPVVTGMIRADVTAINRHVLNFIPGEGV